VRSAFEEHKRREALELAKLKKAGRHASPAGLLSAGGGAGGLDGVSRCTAPHVGTTVPRPAHNCGSVIFCGSLDVPPGGSTTTLPATLPSSLQALQQPHAHHHGSQSRSASVIESLAMTDARSDAAFLAKEKVTPRTQCVLSRTTADLFLTSKSYTTW
jgi:hypothetical protein